LQTPSSILTNIRCHTYEEVLLSNHPTLGEMAAKNEQWHIFTLAYISAGITSYLDFVGRRNSMNDAQVAETAELLLEDYRDMKFDDIALFIRNCKKARYGRLYDLNGSVLLDWFREYDNQRWEVKRRLDKKAHEAEEVQQAVWEKRLGSERGGKLISIGEIAGDLIDKLKINTQKL